MKKLFTIFLITFLLFGIALPSGFVLASHDDSSDNSGSGSDDSSDSDNSGSSDGGSGEATTISATEDDSSDDSDEDRDEKDDDDEDNSGKREVSREEFKREIRTADGRRVEIERKIEVNEDGTFKVKIKRKIRNADGSIIKEVIVIERDEDGIRKRIRLEGFDGFDVETELELRDEFEGEDSELVAVLSNGRKAEIKFMPDQVVELALERLKSLNFTIELKEIKFKNEQRVVYNVETNKTGRFLGIFKLKLKLEGQIDPETGEFIRTNKPWWAFLVAGEDGDEIGEGNKVTLCHIPPGNPDAKHTITVGAPAVKAHTLRHGDTLGACEGDTGTGDGNETGNDTGEDENQTTVELTVNLTEENNSSESGTATLVEENGQITLNISMIGAPEGVSQPAHIHLGSCPDVGSVSYPLTDILNGESITIINVTLNQLESELPLAINVHKSINESSIYVACGNLTFS